MRPSHKKIFEKAAKKFNCEIAVRPSNAASEQYIGSRGYKPKPIQCKAKTAKKGPNAGLVVSPFLCPKAFNEGDLRFVRKTWKEDFEHILKTRGAGFCLNEKKEDPRYGCVLFHGDYLYSDYDLMSIKKCRGIEIMPRAQKTHFSKNLKLPSKAGSTSEIVEDHTKPIERAVLRFVQARSGIMLIQHGAAINEPGKAPRREKCHVFRPGKPFYRYETMPKTNQS